MADNIVAQPETIAKTKKLFIGLLVRPLNEKSLQRPPFKFIQEIIKNIVSETRVLADLYSSKELDTSRTLDKSTKIAFIQKLIVFLEKEVANTMKLDVRATLVVAGLDPDKTNQMLQTLAYVIMSKRTRKSLQSIVSSQENVKQNKKNTSSSVKSVGSLPRQTLNVERSSEPTSLTNKINIDEINKVLQNINSKEKRTESSVYTEFTDRSAKHNNNANVSSRNSLNDNMISSRRNSSSQQIGSPRHTNVNDRSNGNKTSPKIIRPTTASKPPPRTITEKELITVNISTDSSSRSSARLDSRNIPNSMLSPLDISSNEDRIELFEENTGQLKSNDDSNQASSLSTIDNSILNSHDNINKEKATTSFVRDQVNSLEDVINKSELLKLMNYQDGLKKFELRADSSVRNDQVSLVDADIDGLNDDQNKPVGDDSSLLYSKQRKNSAVMDQTSKIQEQTNKIKQSLKILSQFIPPVTKAVNFIFEDFDAIMTDCDRYLDKTNKNIKSATLIKFQNVNNSQLAISKLNDLEIKIELATQEKDQLYTQIVQNEKNIRKKISHYISTF